MPGPNDAEAISTDVCSDLARIFAAALLRLSSRAALSGNNSKTNPPTCLEVPPKTVLSDHHG
ncbi:hypothetical protein CA54_61200 [Symmachiella macrocystis]|uniref:Uncharacterized protein n=1 Tax=Symmachiella macrocystis TaxID=2527985 RepID=A0A5C6AVF9_9PLAN|nr:hypothetical protein CA54_61200 [Symmachiella macrocystis]